VLLAAFTLHADAVGGDAADRDAPVAGFNTHRTVTELLDQEESGHVQLRETGWGLLIRHVLAVIAEIQLLRQDIGWGPMYHWTDSKILVHAFYCMVGISLLQSIYKQAQTAWPGLSMEQMLNQLRQIEQFVLLYGDKGPQRAAVVQAKQTFPQQQLARVLGLDELARSHTR
jgi:hypothetical protein